MNQQRIGRSSSCVLALAVSLAGAEAVSAPGQDREAEALSTVRGGREDLGENEDQEFAGGAIVAFSRAASARDTDQGWQSAVPQLFADSGRAAAPEGPNGFQGNQASVSALFFQCFSRGGGTKQSCGAGSALARDIRSQRSC